MWEFFTHLFDSSGFEARRQGAGWTEQLSWLHNTADALIWLAFLAIPALLVYFVRRRKRAPFPFMFWMFGAFIILAGLTHFMEVVTFYTPLYRLSALVKVLTVIASWATVIALAPLVPRALALRDPEELEREIAERKRVEEELRVRQEELAKHSAELARHSAELTRSEEAYKYQSKILRSILDSISDAVIVADGKGKFILLNAAAEQILGKGPAEAVTDTWTQRSGLFLPNRSTPYPIGELPLMKAVRGESVDGVEIFVRHSRIRQGMWVSASARPLLDDQGKRQGGVAVFRNVTAQKQVEERLRQSEERFRLLVEGVKEYAIIWLAPDGRVVSWNSGAERIQGYRTEDVVGKHFSCFYPPEDIADGKPERELSEALACGRVENESWRVRKDGSHFWADVVIRAVHDPAGHLLGFAKVTRDITERKQAEEKIRLFADIVRNVQVGLCVLRLEDPTDLHSFRIVSLNPAGSELGHLPAEEAIGKTLGEVSPAAYDTPLPRLCAEVIRSGQATTLEDFHYGDSRIPEGFFAIKAFPLPNQSVGLAFESTTERKLAAESLGQKTELLQLLYDVTMAANEATSAPEVLQACLDRVCGHTGWPLGHAWVFTENGSGGPHASHLWHVGADWYEKFRRETETLRFAPGEGLHGQVLATGKPVWVEDFNQSPQWPRAGLARQTGIRSGLAFPVLVGKKVAAVLEFFTPKLVPPNQTFLQALANVANQLGQVIERERARQALLEGQELSRSIIETANDAFIAIDARGLITDWNRQAEQTFGWPRAEAIGRLLAETIIPPQHREAHTRGLERFLASGEGPVLNRRIELVALHHQGHEFPVELTISPLRQGKGYRFNAFVHDITERKKAEHQLKSFAGRLERSNRELESFASVASHDLQEPLRKIQAFGGRLEAKCAGQLDPQGLDYLARIQNAAGRMRSLIDDLLAFSRVTTKAQPFTPVDLGQVAREVVTDLEESIRTSSGRVELSELPTVEADPAQMRRLLQNLIGNALKFHHPDQPPVVRVEGQVIGGSGNGHRPALQLRVADNGIGFDEKYLGRLFQVFARLHGRDEYEGTGMGLAICRKIAERHGGSITAHSAPGQGATFTVTLPVQQPPGKEGA